MTARPDWRHLVHGLPIPTDSYADQPYIVRTGDGAWLCCMTTGPGEEGARGQRVVTYRSPDRGRSWIGPLPVEPPDSPEYSYAVMLRVPASPRVFIFYNHNTDNVREVKRHDGQGTFSRVDSLGHFVFRWSDDHGRSWSARRCDIPLRRFRCDQDNVYGGELCFFWNVGRPFVADGAAYVSLHKVGQMGRGFFQQSEGVLLRSPNLLTEPDPDRATWEMLPVGDIGLRTPPGGGPIAEEQSYAVLSDGSFHCVYRSIDGHPVESYSRDGGRTWSTPRYKCFADGRRMKHPRAANFAWRCTNGRYLYWFHNHGGRFIREHPQGADWVAYEDRNPVWLSAGEEVDTPTGRELRWSEPEIVLYDDDPYVRISYPDLVEEDDRFWLTETQKNLARLHELEPRFLDRLFHQFTARSVATDGLLLDLAGHALPAAAPMPPLPAFLERDHARADYGTRDRRAGFSIEVCARLDGLGPGQVLLDNRTEGGAGVCLQTTARGTLELVLHDGRTENRWDCDPGLLRPGTEHHIVATVDGGPKIITFVVDGRLCDGGETRQFGWGRFSPHLRTPQGAATLRIGPALAGRLSLLRIYGRALMTSEAIGNWRSLSASGQGA